VLALLYFSGRLCPDLGAHLSLTDVTVDNLSNPSVLQVRIKASKTDPLQVGQILGRTGDDICPISAMLAY